jgi:stearoyl-CoA desaturase (delta-9 desaturase)
MSTSSSDPARWVMSSNVMRRAQAVHTRVVVGVPLVLLLAGAWLLPAQVDWALAVASFMLMGAITGCLGISVGFHRHFAHRAFRARPWLRVVMAVAGQMAAQGPVLYWTALHRRHHSFSDRPGDPHSPTPHAQALPRSRWRAFWHGHIGWAAGHEVPLPTRYVADLLADRAIRRVNAGYNGCVLAGLVLPALLGLAWTRNPGGAVVGFYFGGVLRLVVSTQAIWAINSVCHRFGSRPHDTGDFSTNNAWLAPLTFGECWHNNHHHAPTHARFGQGWRQPDPGWWTIAVLRRLGLVWDVLGEGLKAQDRERQPAR